jgi:hypothetical protein
MRMRRCRNRRVGRGRGIVDSSSCLEVKNELDVGGENAGHCGRRTGCFTTL